MAGTVVGLNMTTVSLCDDTTGWSGSPSPDVNDPALFGQREGSYCLQSYQASSGTRSADFTYGTDQNLADRIIYMWFATSRITGLPNKGSTGMRIRIEDASANWAEWDIFGADTLPHGGWICWAVETSSTTSSRDGGTFPTLTAIRKIGWRCGGTVLGKTYIYWDAVRFGQGLNIYGGTSGDPAEMDDFATSEATNAWGVVNKYKGVYYIQGKLNFGSTSAAQATYFKEVGKSLIFQDNPVTASFYELKTLTNADADTEVYFGESSGISGCIMGVESASQTAKYVIDLSPSQRTKIGIYGCTIKRSGNISLPPYDASYSRKVLNASFEGCGQIDPDSCPMETCNVISTASIDAALLWNENIDIINVNFIGNTAGAGIEHPSAAGSPYAYDGLLFSGNTYDVYNSSGSAIEINKNNGSNPSTSEGSSVTFLGTAVDTVITVKDLSTGSIISGARVLVWVTDGANFPYQDSVSITGSGTTATVIHNSHGLATGDNVIIQGANEDVYNGAFTITKIDTNSYSYTTNYTITSSPATGTITATFAFINASTDGSGIASDEDRLVNSNQPITGWVRSGTSSPYYQQGSITGIVSSSNGFSTTVLLAKDE